MKIIIFFIIITISSLSQAMSKSDLDEILSHYHNLKVCILLANTKGYHKEKSIIYLARDMLKKGGMQNAFTQSKWRTYFHDAEASIIQSIFNGLLPANNFDSIIEIGSGELEYDGYSFLVNLMSKYLRDRITMTDINKRLVKKYPKLKRLDLSHINYEPSSISMFIGSSVLDTLGDEDLHEALKNIHQALKVGGYLVHIASMPPFIDTLIDSYREYICFPSINENNFNGLFYIDKNTFNEFMAHNNQLPELEHKFFQWYISLDDYERASVLLSIAMDSKTIAVMLGNLIKKFNLELNYIDNNEFFEHRMRENLQTTGFKIEKMDTYQRSKIRPRNNNDDSRFNYFNCVWGVKKCSNIYVMPLDMVCYSSSMHVIIAQKNHD